VCLQGLLRESSIGRDRSDVSVAKGPLALATYMTTPGGPTPVGTDSDSSAPRRSDGNFIALLRMAANSRDIERIRTVLANMRRANVSVSCRCAPHGR
jgi:hypothetical protein